jgi:hypothetical protein
MLLPSGGIYWLSKGNWFQTGKTIGTVQGGFQYDPIYDTDTWVPGDDSVKVLLYGLLTILFIFAFIYTWRLQVKQCRICMDITAQGKKVKSGKDDMRSLLDDQFHKTLLALPLGGILAFTVLPIIYMVLIAFTSYDAAHDGYSNLFSWVGLHNFNDLLNFGKGGLGLAFGEILSLAFSLKSALPKTINLVREIAKTITAVMPPMAVTILPKRESFSFNGDEILFLFCNSLAMRPNSALPPTAVTIISPLPATTNVPP